MIGSLFYGLIAVLILLPLAVWAFRGVLRWMDKHNCRSWDFTYAKIADDPLAAAVYHGCRLLAVAIICYAVFGRIV